MHFCELRLKEVCGADVDYLLCLGDGLTTVPWIGLFLKHAIVFAFLEARQAGLNNVNLLII
jgi:hypothetical protein